MAKMLTPKIGCPTKLTETLIKQVCAEVRKNVSMGNAARITRIHPESFRNWMETGFEDAKYNKNTVFAQFFVNVRENQGLKIAEMLQKIEAGQKNWQGIAWILEKCCADDFGRDSELYKQLLVDYKKLLQDMVDRNQTTQGSIVNGEVTKEVDTKSN